MNLAARVVARTKHATLVQRVARRFKIAGPWDGKFVGRDARLQWSRDNWFLEELPQRGKKKLRQATLQNPTHVGYKTLDWWIPANILMLAKLSSSDDYDGIKKKIADAYEEAIKRTETEPRRSEEKETLEKSPWVRELKWYENSVFYLEVVPEGTDPFKVEGKDFELSVSWTKFKVYSPQSDFNQADPFYTGLEQSSPTSARKLFTMLKADPTALKSVAYNGLEAWLTKNKIKYEHLQSTWH